MDPRFPSWMKLGNAFARGLGAVGLTMGPVRVLTVAGRVSGRPRSTPVTPVEYGGREFIISMRGITDWEKNVRAAGVGSLAAGRKVRRVRLDDIVDDSLKKHVISTFATKVPAGTKFYVDFGIAPDGSAEAMAEASDKISVFEITPA